MEFGRGHVIAGIFRFVGLVLVPFELDGHQFERRAIHFEQLAIHSMPVIVDERGFIIRLEYAAYLDACYL
jgi:hypothetical protein